MSDYIEKLRLDVEDIFRTQDRVAAKSTHNLRWEGTDINPHGWRTMGDHAEDIKELLEERERMLDLLEDAHECLLTDNREDLEWMSISTRIEEFTDDRSKREIDPSVRRDEGQLDGSSPPATGED